MINLLSDSLPDNAYLATLLLYQLGSLPEFGEMEQGDQIEILEFETDIFEIKIVARLNGAGKKHTFKLKVERIERNG